jgi:hypothetical protein
MDDSIIPEIENSHLVVNHFGYWPKFHDSEVMEFTLHRNYPDDPFMELKLYAFESSAEQNEQGFNKLTKQCVIDFEFRGITDNYFTDFNQQNTIVELIIEDLEDYFDVQFVPSDGMEGTISCTAIRVNDLVPVTSDPKNSHLN